MLRHVKENVIFMGNEKTFLGILSKVINFSLAAILIYDLMSFLDHQRCQILPFS